MFCTEIFSSISVRHTPHTKMKILIIHNEFLYTPGFKRHIESFVKAFEKCSATVEVRSNSDFLSCDIETIKLAFDFVLFWDKDLFLARCFERAGIKIFNSSTSIELCDDKARTFEVLSAQNIPMPKTLVAPMTYQNIGFNSFDFLSHIEGQISYPLVVKERFSSFGMGVFLAQNREELIKIISKADCRLLFQEFVSASFGRDLRVIVSHGKVIASMMRENRNGDFRSNIELGGVACRAILPPAAAVLAVKAVSALGLAFGGVDLLFNDGSFLVCEVNSNPHLTGVSEASGKDVAFEICQSLIQNI